MSYDDAVHAPIGGVSPQLAALLDAADHLEQAVKDSRNGASGSHIDRARLTAQRDRALTAYAKAKAKFAASAAREQSPTPSDTLPVSPEA